MKIRNDSSEEAAIAKTERRVKREADTVHLMLKLYCRDHHERAAYLCSDCRVLWAYVQERLTRCPLRANKPTCVNCTIHCYKPAMRQQIRTVMRYAGPRMVWRHPILSVLHLLDNRVKSRRLL